MKKRPFAGVDRVLSDFRLGAITRATADARLRVLTAYPGLVDDANVVWLHGDSSIPLSRSSERVDGRSIRVDLADLRDTLHTCVLCDPSSEGRKQEPRRQEQGLTAQG